MSFKHAPTCDLVLVPGAACNCAYGWVVRDRFGDVYEKLGTIRRMIAEIERDLNRHILRQDEERRRGL